MLEMLNRAVGNGHMPDYVLVDSFVFCSEILDRLSKLKSGTIKLVSMVKINNQLLYDCRANKELNVKTILQRHLNDTKTLRPSGYTNITYLNKSSGWLVGFIYS